MSDKPFTPLLEVLEASSPDELRRVFADWSMKLASSLPPGSVRVDNQSLSVVRSLFGKEVFYLSVMYSVRFGVHGDQK